MNSPRPIIPKPYTRTERKCSNQKCNKIIKPGERYSVDVSKGNKELKDVPYCWDCYCKIVNQETANR